MGPGQPITAMVVDNDGWVRRGVSNILAADPEITVLEPCRTAQDGIDTYKRHHPSVVLMDVDFGLDTLNGIDATAAIMAADPWANVMLLTTITPGPGLARAIDAGARATLDKDMDPESIVAAVKTLARGGQPTDFHSLGRSLMVSMDFLPQAPIGIPPLSDQERQVLTLLYRGQNYRQIAEEMRGVGNGEDLHQAHDGEVQCEQSTAVDHRRPALPLPLRLTRAAPPLPKNKAIPAFHSSSELWNAGIALAVDEGLPQ